MIPREDPLKREGPHTPPRQPARGIRIFKLAEDIEIDPAAHALGGDKHTGTIPRSKVSDFPHPIAGTDHTNALRVTDGGGLNADYEAGRASVGVTHDIVAGTIALTASQTNSIYVNSSGAVTKSTSGFPSNSVPLAVAITDGSGITSLADKRSPFYTAVIPVATDDVSSPPTDAELDTAFGQPSALGEGYTGIVDDDGGGATVWLCFVVNGAWWYEQLTKAV